MIEIVKIKLQARYENTTDLTNIKDDLKKLLSIQSDFCLQIDALHLTYVNPMLIFSFISFVRKIVDTVLDKLIFTSIKTDSDTARVVINGIFKIIKPKKQNYLYKSDIEFMFYYITNILISIYEKYIIS